MSRVWLTRVYDATNRPLGPLRIAVRVMGITTTYYLNMHGASVLVAQLNKGIAKLHEARYNQNTNPDCKYKPMGGYPCDLTFPDKRQLCPSCRRFKQKKHK